MKLNYNLENLNSAALKSVDYDEVSAHYDGSFPRNVNLAVLALYESNNFLVELDNWPGVFTSLQKPRIAAVLRRRRKKWLRELEITM
jgi:hypothetical protein